MSAPGSRRARRLCRHCGLPVAYRGELAEDDPRGLFCCFGCSLAWSVVGGEDARSGSAASGIFSRLMLAVFLSMAVMIFSLALYSDAWFPPTADGGHPLGPLAPIFGWIAFGFATPVLLLLGWPLLRHNIVRPDRDGGIGVVNLLVLTGVLSAYVLSVVHLVRGEGSLYFETGVMVLVLVTLGRFLDAKARHGATRALGALLELDPREASRRVRPGGDDSTTWERVPLESVAVGDVVRAVAGERVPVDGEVESGGAVLDLSILTGESAPRETGPGDTVHAGALVLDGRIDVEVRGVVGHRLLDRMAETVDDALENRTPLELLAERVVRTFLPAAVALAVGAALWHGRAGDWDEAVLRGLAVLLIACPCALGLATPLVVWIGVGKAARAGILVRGGEVFELLARPTRIFFDKTGTLTTGRPELAATETRSGRDADDCLRLARRLAELSSHPLAATLVESSAVEPAADEVRGFRSVPGRGLAGEASGHRLLLGSRRFLEDEGVDTSELGDDDDPQPRTWLAIDGELAASFRFRERLRAEAPSVIEELRSLGASPSVLTGDTTARGAQLARELGVPVEAELLPTDKVERVHTARASGRTTVMVGDGVNDAPVLAAADAGIALGEGAELSREVAGAVLLDDGSELLRKIPRLLDLSRRAVRKIRFNLFWAFAYNGVGMALAATGSIHPLVAALLMVASSLFVVGCSVSGWEPTESSAAPTDGRSVAPRGGSGPEDRPTTPSAQEVAR